MKNVLFIEKAYIRTQAGDVGNFIGYRLSVAGIPCLLIYEDQKILSGFKMGTKFVAGVNEIVEYRPTSIVEV